MEGDGADGTAGGQREHRVTEGRAVVEDDVREVTESLARGMARGGAGAVPDMVARAAGDGDRVAERLLSGAVKRLVTTLDALSPSPEDTLVTTGGLLGPDGVLLRPLERRLAPRGLRPVPVPDGLAGAVALARKALLRTG
jgi:N-acetylglucosamine kinase-like BadF-type ATPase